MLLFFNFYWVVEKTAGLCLDVAHPHTKSPGRGDNPFQGVLSQSF